MFMIKASFPATSCKKVFSVLVQIELKWLKLILWFIYTKQPVLRLLMLSSFIFWVSLKEITIYKAWTQISQFWCFVYHSLQPTLCWHCQGKIGNSCFQLSLLIPLCYRFKLSPSWFLAFTPPSASCGPSSLSFWHLPFGKGGAFTPFGLAACLCNMNSGTLCAKCPGPKNNCLRGERAAPILYVT